MRRAASRTVVPVLREPINSCRSSCHGRCNWSSFLKMMSRPVADRFSTGKTYEQARNYTGQAFERASGRGGFPACDLRAFRAKLVTDIKKPRTPLHERPGRFDVLAPCRRGDWWRANTLNGRVLQVACQKSRPTGRASNDGSVFTRGPAPSWPCRPSVGPASVAPFRVPCGANRSGFAVSQAHCVAIHGHYVRSPDRRKYGVPATFPPANVAIAQVPRQPAKTHCGGLCGACACVHVKAHRAASPPTTAATTQTVAPEWTHPRRKRAGGLASA